MSKVTVFRQFPLETRNEIWNFMCPKRRFPAVLDPLKQEMGFRLFFCVQSDRFPAVSP